MAIEANGMANQAEPGGGLELARNLGDHRASDLPAVRLVASGYTEPKSDDAAAPDATALLRALRRCWAPGLGLGLVASVVVGLTTWTFMPSPKFVAKAALQAASTPPRILSTVGGERADFGTYLRTQVAMIKGRLVLNRLLARPGIAALPLFREVGDPLEWLEKELQVESNGGNELLKVSLKGEYPEDLARVVNELSDSYLRETREQEARERSDRLRKLTENHDRYLADRSERRKTLKSFAEGVGSNDRRTLSVKQELDLERLEMTRRELLYLQSDLRKARVDLRVIEARDRPGPAQAVSAWAVADEVASDPVVGSQSVRVVDLEGRLARARRTIRGEGDPAIRRVHDELESTRRVLAARRGEIMKAAGQRMGEQAVQDAAGRIASSSERVAILEEHERILTGEVGRIAEEARNLNRTSIALEDSRGEMDQADEMVKKIASEIEAQKVELLAPSRVRMLEGAEAPTKRDSRPRLKATFAAGGGAFALSLLVLTWRESQAGRIDSTQVVKRQLGLKVLGVLPRLEDRLRRQVHRPSTPWEIRRASLYFESIDATRAMLLRLLDGTPSVVVLITSALKAEGKTSLTCHLAASLARAGKSTLLVDGDLRIPSAHKLLNLPSGGGLSEIMRGEMSAREAIRPTTYDGLMFLPTGECDAAALDALSRGKVGEIFAELREQFEIILVDSSPILPVADPIQFGRHCDAIVLSILENVSTVPAIRAAFDRLGSIDVPVLGAVVAGSPMMHYKYQFYRKPASDSRRGRPGDVVPSSRAASLPAAAVSRTLS
jgi:succinoglycan biosynthesis transport protein ExoP